MKFMEIFMELMIYSLRRLLTLLAVPILHLKRQVII